MHFDDLFPVEPLLDELSTLLSKAKGEAEIFYTAGGRNILFRLETVARIAGGLGDKDDFDDAKERFKKSEDLFGEYDFYVAWLKIFNGKKKCLGKYTEVFNKNITAIAEEIRDDLNDWNDFESENTIHNFRKYCHALHFEDEKALSAAFSAFIIKSANKLVKEYRQGTFSTTDIEKGLHELRRKLRWISLYIQNANGLIQLKPSLHPEKKFADYLTPETLSSPFMKLPENKSISTPVHIRTETYAAFSSIIAEIGALKDQGLATALFHGNTDLLACAGIKNPDNAELLEKADRLITKFFEHDDIPAELIHDLTPYT